jgi:hypothetical protein
MTWRVKLRNVGMSATWVGRASSRAGAILAAESAHPGFVAVSARADASPDYEPCQEWDD